MNDLTLESLARRVEALEQALRLKLASSGKDWRSAVGMFAESEFMKGPFP